MDGEGSLLIVQHSYYHSSYILYISYYFYILVTINDRKKSIYFRLEQINNSEWVRQREVRGRALISQLYKSDKIIK